VEQPNSNSHVSENFVHMPRESHVSLIFKQDNPIDFRSANVGERCNVILFKACVIPLYVRKA
jgi:hypothetical protein